MFPRTFPALGAALLLAGCAAGVGSDPIPMSSDHPASELAAEAPPRPASDALDLGAFAAATGAAPTPASPASASPSSADPHAAHSHDASPVEVHPDVSRDRSGRHDAPLKQPADAPQALDRVGSPAASTRPATAPARFACPHHPEVVQDRPGVCPKCEMRLVSQPPAPPPTTQPGGHGPAHQHGHH